MVARRENSEEEEESHINNLSSINSFIIPPDGLCLSRGERKKINWIIEINKWEIHD